MATRSRVFNPKLIRRHLELVRRREGELWQIVFFGPLGRHIVGLFDEPDAVVNELARVDAAGAGNVCIGVNPLRGDLVSWDQYPELRNRLRSHSFQGRTQDVTRITNLFLDLDPHTTGRKKAAEGGKMHAPSSVEERRWALRVAGEIVKREQLDHCTIFMSGNGGHVLIPIDQENTPEAGARRAAYQADLRERHRDLFFRDDDNFIQLDSVHDPVRLQALAGTLKIKGRESERRRYMMAKIVEQRGDPCSNVDARTQERLLGYDVSGAAAQGGNYQGERSVVVPKDLTAIPGWCELWNTIWLEAPPSPRQGRSGTIYMIARKLAHDRVAREDALAMLTLFIKAHGFEKFWRSRNVEVFLGAMLDRAAATPLSCERAASIREDLKVCDQCQWARRKGRPPGVRPIKPDERALRREAALQHPALIDTTVEVNGVDVLDTRGFVSLSTARSILTTELNGYLLRHCRAPGVLGGERPPVLLVRGPPGLGKSTTITWLLSQRSAGTKVVEGEFGPEDQEAIDAIKGELRFVFLVPRGDRLREVEDEFARYGCVTFQDPGETRPAPLDGLRVGTRSTTPVVTIRGKISTTGPQLCHRAERIKWLRDRGYSCREHALSCLGCKHKSDCEYLMQFRQTDCSWIAVMQHIGTPRLDLEHGGANKPDVIVLDEGLMDIAVKRPFPYSLDDLEQARFRVEIKWPATHPLARALRCLVEVAQQAGEAVDGRQLRALLVEHQPELSSWLEEGLRDMELVNHLELLPQRAIVQIASIKNVIPLLKALRRDFELDALVGHVRLASRRAWANNLGYVLHEPLDFELGDLPVVVLDASADVELYRAVLGRDVEVVDVDVLPECEVYQLGDGHYGIEELTREGARNDVIRDELLELTELIAELSPLGAALVCAKRFEARVRERLGDRVKVYLHYGALRGTNIVIDERCSDLILLGMHMPPLHDLAARAAVIDHMPHSADVEYRWRPYGMVDDNGDDWEAHIVDVRDREVSRWLHLGREQEMVQAAHRIRPIIRADHRKRIWVLTSVPLPGLPPTRLFKNRREMKTHIEALLALMG